MARPAIRTFAAITTLLIAISLPGDRPASAPARQAPNQHPDLQRMLLRGNSCFSASQFTAALREYQTGLAATPASLPQYSALFLTGIGNCEGMLWRNADAIRSFNEAIRIARRHSLPEIEIKAAVGRISIYKRIPDFTAAQQAVRELRNLLGATHDPATLVQIASIAREIDFDESLRLYHRAVTEGSMKSDLQSLSMLWGQLGNLWLLRGDAERAEPALTEAFRLRAMAGRRELQGFYFYLGWLRRLQGRYREAELLLLQARGRSAEPGGLNAWFVDRELARTAAGAGKLQEALRHYESAARLAEDSRAFAVPAATFRLAAEEGLHDLFTEYVELGMRLYERHPSRSLAARLLTAADRSRSSLFRAALAQQTALPPAYLAKVGEYRHALAAALTQPAEPGSSRLDGLRLELANLEVDLGIGRENDSPQFLEKDASGNALKGIQRKLRDTELLLSFLVARSGSFVWAVTRNSLEVHRLPGAARLAESVARYRRSLESHGADAEELGTMLSKELLSPVGAAARSQRDWIVSLDAPLFDLPLSCLPDPASGAPLCERHSLRLTPAAALRNEEAEPPQRNRRFAGLADPVYNRADTRGGDGNAVLTPVADKGELPRLPGSARELKRCARAWALDPSPELATGSQANRDRLQQALRRRPAVLHLGMHVVRHPVVSEEVMIALGKGSGEADYLSPVEIAKWRCPLGLVTLSGCSSGTGRARPGLGLFGLTRAWLTAGAASVVASYWPIRDDDGQLLATMYTELSTRGGRTQPADVARALQKAQNRSRRRNDWQAHPSYWAAFFVAGKE